MLVTLPLEDMSIEEKLQAMEALWDDLCKNADRIKSPSWHQEILDGRERSLKNGDDEFVDWDRAKKIFEILLHENKEGRPCRGF